MKKRLWLMSLSLTLLTVVLALFFGCTPPANPPAEEPPVPEVNATVGLSYQLSEDGASYMLMGRGEATDVNLVIPSEHEGLPVTAISGSAFYQDEFLVSIYIPATIEDVGVFAFLGCPKLVSIEAEHGGRYTASGNCLIDTKTSTLIRGCNNSVIPDVRLIAGSAFRDCVGLASVEIPASVTFVGPQAFKGCTSLQSVSLGASLSYLSDSLFEGCKALTFIHIPKNIVGTGEDIFADCTSLDSVLIDNGIQSLGYGMFQNCTALRSILLPDTLVEIKGETFAGCTSLYSIHLPDSIQFIGGSTFSGCTALSNVNLPESITCIYTGTFKDCTSLVSIEIPENVKTIRTGAFEGAGLFYIRIPSTVNMIEYMAFLNCGLTFVDIEAGVICVQSLAFKGCQWLRQVRCGDTKQPEEWGEFLAESHASVKVFWGYDLAN